MSAAKRPLSPHLGVYRWGAHMLVSILHRATGAALGAGTLLVAWGLIAAAAGPEAYGLFQDCITSPIGRLLLFGFTWALLQHMASGLRHLYMDTGSGYALGVNRGLAIATLLASTALTLVAWFSGYGLI